MKSVVLIILSFITITGICQTVTKSWKNIDYVGDSKTYHIGGAIQDNKDKCALANPITYIDTYDPPFLILHGDKDPLVPHCQSILLHEAFSASNVKNQFVLVSVGQHGPGMFEEKYYKMMVDFFIYESSKR